jgi:hypothetical protein
VPKCREAACSSVGDWFDTPSARCAAEVPVGLAPSRDSPRRVRVACITAERGGSKDRRIAPESGYARTGTDRARPDRHVTCNTRNAVISKSNRVINFLGQSTHTMWRPHVAYTFRGVPTTCACVQFGSRPLLRGTSNVTVYISAVISPCSSIPVAPTPRTKLAYTQTNRRPGCCVI